MSERYSAGVATAYGAALRGGYTGTYNDFCNDVAKLGDITEELGDISATATTLEAGSSATASYNEGVFAFGIPRGNTGAQGERGETGAKGDKGDTGETGATGATGNGIASIAKTGTSGLVDTYTITFTDGTTSTFTVTNGAEAIDATLSIAGRAADAKATGDEIGNLKSDLNHIETPQIVGMIPTGESETSDNLFSEATLVATGKYVGGINSITGKASLYDNSLLDTYIIPVDGISTYTFTNCRTACVVSDLEYTAVGELFSYATEIDSTGGRYILFSFKPTDYPTTSYSITKPVPSYYIPTNWVVNPVALKDPTDKASGAIASDGTMSITGRTAIKDGEMIAFKGKFASFSGFTLNFFGTAVTNYIAVTNSTIAIKNTASTPTPVSHGLTIQNEVALTVEFIEGKARISLYSIGNLYTQTVDWYQAGGTVSQPQVKSDGTTFSEATLVTSYDSATRNIWYFGDSYTGSASSDRWCYYLKENGYLKNALINGSAGGTSGGAMIAFNALLKYGTPKIAVFATGMNDGSDSTAPPTTYVTRRTEFISLCESNGIDPVFCTVPTVPSVNNEQKNAWVRSSGYRYIDFASAVGADGTGTWYSGMLSSDNVHPTALGAKALYTQVLIDLPEITLT